MNDTVVLALGDNAELASRLASRLGTDRLVLEQRQFPDAEWYLRIVEDCKGRDVLIVAALEYPDSKILPLLFAGDLLRDLGARQRTLIAPYLPYMRQDIRFKPGEALTSRSFARLLSNGCDRLVTVDPHLHRFRSLDEIYTIPARVVHAAPLLAQWIERSVENALVIGPDAESEQWVREVAALAGVPYLVLNKVRRGDRDVVVSVPDVGRWRGCRPVLVDDIISTARTMISAVGELVRQGFSAPDCVGVHAVFAGDAYAALRAAGAGRVVTTNAIMHASNAIDLTGVLAEAVEEAQ